MQQRLGANGASSGPAAAITEFPRSVLGCVHDFIIDSFPQGGFYVGSCKLCGQPGSWPTFIDYGQKVPDRARARETKYLENLYTEGLLKNGMYSLPRRKGW